MSSDYLNGVSASHCGAKCKFNFRAVLASCIDLRTFALLALSR